MQIRKLSSDFILVLIVIKAVISGRNVLVAQDTGPPWMNPKSPQKHGPRALASRKEGKRLGTREQQAGPMRYRFRPQFVCQRRIKEAFSDGQRISIRSDQ